MSKRQSKRPAGLLGWRGGSLLAGRRGCAAALAAVLAVAALTTTALLRSPGLNQPDPTAARGEVDEIPPRPDFASAAETTPEVARLRDECFDVAEDLVRALPNNPHALCLLGTVHNLFANEDEALRLWRRCLALDPLFADAHLALGQWQVSKGDLTAAEMHFEEAVRLDPLWDDVCLPYADALLKQGKSREAAQALEPFVQRNPHSTEGWCRLGRAYQETEDYANARRCYLEAIAVDDACADAWYGVAQSRQKLGEAETANEALDRFRQLHAEQDRAKREERVHYTDENRLRVPLVNAHMTAARVYALHRRWNEAEVHWKRAADLEPRHRECRESLAETYAAQQRLDEARRMRKELCDLEPRNARRWLSLGILCYQSGHPQDAEAAFRRVIELAPDKSEGYAALAQIQVLPGRDLQEAIELARTAVRLAPTAPNHFILADALWRAGDLEASRAALQEALRLDPTEPRYREAHARMKSVP